MLHRPLLRILYNRGAIVFEVDRSLIIAAIEAHESGITIADCKQPEMPLVFVNKGFCQLTGYNRDEIIGKNCRFLQGANTDQSTVKEIRSALMQGHNYRGELLNYRKDGSTFWNKLRLCPIYDNEGGLSHFVGIQNDITSVKQLQLERERLLEDLSENNERLRYFGREVAHDVRTSIGLVKSLSELLKEELEDKVSKEVETYIDDILRITNKAIEELQKKTLATLED